MAASPYLNPGLAFNRSAIMAAVHGECRRIIARAVEIGCAKPVRYAVAFRDASATIWAAARIHRECAIRDAKHAALPIEHVRLINARTTTLMIDSTQRMLAELAAIDAQAAAMGVRL